MSKRLSYIKKIDKLAVKAEAEVDEVVDPESFATNEAYTIAWNKMYGEVMDRLTFKAKVRGSRRYGRVGA